MDTDGLNPTPDRSKKFADYVPRQDSPQIQSSTEDNQSKPGLLAGFGVVFLILLGLRYVIGKIDNPKAAIGVATGAVLLLLATRFTRRYLVAGLLFVFLVSSGVYVGKNFKAISSGRIGLKDGINGVIKVSMGMGPLKSAKGIIDDIKVKREKAKLKSSSTLLKLHPGLNINQYLRVVDARSAGVNTMASKIVADCQSGDDLCVASKILSFVTDRITYRKDPLSRSFEGDYPKPPLQTLEAQAGDCEDKTILLISLLGTLGIHSYMVFEKGHAHALVCFDREIETIIVDQYQASGDNGIAFLSGVFGSPWKQNLVAYLNKMPPPYILENRYCYPAETTMVGSWFGVEMNPDHIGVYNPFTAVELTQN